MICLGWGVQRRERCGTVILRSSKNGRWEKGPNLLKMDPFSHLSFQPTYICLGSNDSPEIAAFEFQGD